MLREVIVLKQQNEPMWQSLSDYQTAAESFISINSDSEMLFTWKRFAVEVKDRKQIIKRVSGT